MAPIVIPTSSNGYDDSGSEGWGEGSDGFESAEGSGGPEWVWIGVRASVVGFFFLGLKLLDCVQFLFGVKMKENKRRFWIGGSVCVVMGLCFVFVFVLGFCFCFCFCFCLCVWGDGFG